MIAMSFSFSSESLMHPHPSANLFDLSATIRDVVHLARSDLKSTPSRFSTLTAAPSATAQSLPPFLATCLTLLNLLSGPAIRLKIL